MMFLKIRGKIISSCPSINQEIDINIQRVRNTPIYTHTLMWSGKLHSLPMVTHVWWGEGLESEGESNR